MGRASHRRARRKTDAGSSPRCGKGCFSQSQLSVQTLLRCPYSPRVQSHASTSVRTLKIPKRWQPCHCLDTRKYSTLIELDSAALAAAVPYPGKGQGSTKKKKKKKKFFLKENGRSIWGKMSGERAISRKTNKQTKTQRTKQRNRAREKSKTETGKWNQHLITALIFQTGGTHQISPVFLLG